MTSRPIADAMRRSADQDNGQFAEVPATPHVRTTVTAVTPREGREPAVTVLWRGSNVPATYGAQFTPAVGQRVLCAYFDNQLEIIQHSVGQQ